MLRTVPHGDFFSVGGMLAAYGRHSGGSLAPWLLSASVLVALASWDPLATGGRFDMILLGLAAYELLIAITRPKCDVLGGLGIGRGADLMGLRSAGAFTGRQTAAADPNGFL
jgi:hypothetical protein